jgi:hypothetical protein
MFIKKELNMTNKNKVKTMRIVFHLIEVILLLIIIGCVNNLNTRLDSLEETIVGSSQAIVTEVYRFREE